MKHSAAKISFVHVRSIGVIATLLTCVAGRTGDHGRIPILTRGCDSIHGFAVPAGYVASER
jgi:hypothetical protein